MNRADRRRAEREIRRTGKRAQRRQMNAAQHADHRGALVVDEERMASVCSSCKSSAPLRATSASDVVAYVLEHGEDCAHFPGKTERGRARLNRGDRP